MSARRGRRKPERVLGQARIVPEIEEAIRRELKEGGKGLHEIAAEQVSAPAQYNG